MSASLSRAPKPARISFLRSPRRPCPSGKPRSHTRRRWYNLRILMRYQVPVEVPLIPRPVPRPWIFPNSFWDPNWLILLCHYFNELRWPPDNHPHPGKISLLELMLDLFISFQTPGPLNVRTLGNQFLQDVPGHARKSKYAYYYLPTPSQSQGLPGQLLTHASHTFLRGAITIPRTNLYCLSMWGYNNVVPALNCRPPLLAGNLVNELLGSTLTARFLKMIFNFCYLES